MAQTALNAVMNLCPIILIVTLIDVYKRQAQDQYIEITDKIRETPLMVDVPVYEMRENPDTGEQLSLIHIYWRSL